MKKLVIGLNRVRSFGASNLDQVKDKEAHGNNLVQKLIINVKINKRHKPCKTWLDYHSLSRGVIPTRGISFKWYLVYQMVVPQVILNFK